MECQCQYCRDCCKGKPGWFLPEEIEPAAKYLNLTTEKFFKKYLGVDWWEGIKPIFVISPATIKMTPGEEYPGDPRGQCVFFKNDKCEIHPVKPFECREATHDNKKEVLKRHKKIMLSWKNKQFMIKNFLGRDPVSKPFYGF